MNKFKKAFTLIELLVVIAIIGILATLAVVALQNSRASARDAKRLADVKQMQTALELYFNDNGSYPTSVTSTIATSGIIYMTTIPVPPTPVDGDCTAENNNYTYSSDGSTYSITFCLGKQTAGLSSGAKVLTRDGVSNSSSGGGSEEGSGEFVCGDVYVDSRDSQQYPTVQIGTQCWFAKNLAYLPSVQDDATFVNMGNAQTPAYGVYGYTGTDVATAKATANYQTYGVLYNWYGAVATSSTTGTEGLQGACPTGWHIPTSAEFDTLSNYLGGNSVSGGKLKQAGTTHWATSISGDTNESGFTALPAGFRNYTSGAFYDMGYYSHFWSSSFSSPNALLRSLGYNYASFYSNSNSPVYGFSVRCLKN